MPAPNSSHRQASTCLGLFSGPRVPLVLFPFFAIQWQGGNALSSQLIRTPPILQIRLWPYGGSTIILIPIRISSTFTSQFPILQHRLTLNNNAQCQS